VLSTADRAGNPWASPVWFAREGDDFLWVSDPGARHSRNLAARPRVAIVVFDSTVEPAAAEALYFEAEAAEDPSGIAAYSRESVAQGLGEWALSDVTAPARHRLYRARVTGRWALGERSQRIPLA
jgi:hypothetical protein